MARGSEIRFHARMMWQSLRWAVGLAWALVPLAGAAADADAALRAFYQRRLDTSFRLEPTTIRGQFLILAYKAAKATPPGWPAS